MSVHLSDVAAAIKEALDASELVSEAEPTGSKPADLPSGSLEYVCAARDCLRGFLITVEEIPFEHVDLLAHPEQYEGRIP